MPFGCCIGRESSPGKKNGKNKHEKEERNVTEGEEMKIQKTLDMEKLNHGPQQNTPRKSPRAPRKGSNVSTPRKRRGTEGGDLDMPPPTLVTPDQLPTYAPTVTMLAIDKNHLSAGDRSAPKSEKTPRKSPRKSPRKESKTPRKSDADEHPDTTSTIGAATSTNTESTATSPPSSTTSTLHSQSAILAATENPDKLPIVTTIAVPDVPSTTPKKPVVPPKPANLRNFKGTSMSARLSFAVKPNVLTKIHENTNQSVQRQRPMILKRQKTLVENMESTKKQLEEATAAGSDDGSLGDLDNLDLESDVSALNTFRAEDFNEDALKEKLLVESLAEAVGEELKDKISEIQKIEENDSSVDLDDLNDLSEDLNLVI